MKDIKLLQGIVSPKVLQRAVSLTKTLKELGIPHALIGGLAVGMYGHIRATKDVDFIVGEEAFDTTEPFLIFREELGQLVAVGETDLMAVPDKYPILREELRVGDKLPIISLGGLILMKLDAFRQRDQDDVRRLLMTHNRAAIRDVRDYLKTHAPELLPRLGQILSES